MFVTTNQASKQTRERRFKTEPSQSKTVCAAVANYVSYESTTKIYCCSDFHITVRGKATGQPMQCVFFGIAVQATTYTGKRALNPLLSFCFESSLTASASTEKSFVY